MTARPRSPLPAHGASDLSWSMNCCGVDDHPHRVAPAPSSVVTRKYLSPRIGSFRSRMRTTSSTCARRGSGRLPHTSAPAARTMLLAQSSALIPLKPGCAIDALVSTTKAHSMPQGTPLAGRGSASARPTVLT